MSVGKIDYIAGRFENLLLMRFLFFMSLVLFVLHQLIFSNEGSFI